MKQSSQSSIFVIALLFVITVSVVLLSSVLNDATFTQGSDAATENDLTIETVDLNSEDACTMSVSVYINEMLEDGTEIPLDFTKYEDLDPAKWGFADTINQPPYANTIITFNHDSLARYDTFVGELAFVPFPKASQIYSNEQTTDLTLFSQDMYSVVRREIKKCSITGSDVWECKESDISTDPYVISNVPVTCNMNLEFGWIVKRGESEEVETEVNNSQGFSKNQSIKFISTDLNGDGITSATDLSIVITGYGQNDPLADVNKDGKVNGLDWTLIVEEIVSEDLE